MAFDQQTRNRLQRFVSDARSLLTEEFTRQLQQEYGLDPATGEVADLSKLGHLDDSRLETARVLREILTHYLASEMATSGKKSNKDVLDRIVREQAFTVLNRLAAFRMMEARGLLIESIANGYQSKGFQLYDRLAGHALGETGDAYRCYLFSLFDEFALDLKVLFDRYAPQGLLFPRESAFLELLDLLNAGDMEALWGEDETIGWIYQYFNSPEERKKMRDEAKSGPRNSRELAVRNQFFTPRYVVEFLVDNSLGRQWFNWTGAQTSLADSCQYLLIKPEERTSAEAPTHLRDPRTIKLLDPACGSMHFGLYAFDLFEVIYREAWRWEQQHGPGSLTSEEGLEPLSVTYDDEEAFARDVPRLIIERNIFGVDIDPRATQIASLALWLRAQRAWHNAGVKANERPLIQKGNVVAAVAPPTESELREQIANQLDELDADLFKRSLVLLKGLSEQGVLLRIEKELPNLIRQVYVGKGNDLFAEQEQKSWDQAEHRLRQALIQFIHAARTSFQGRLFAQDALEGLRLIDLARERFDVVVMNPPFGALSLGVKKEITKAYPRSKNDLLTVFVERGLELLRLGGYLGAITSRTPFFLSSFQKWREEIVLVIGKPEVMADLGHGVMDDAMVEASAYVLERKL
ncbi:MAG: SAM-dependent methyltransferase [Candidatus Thiodiazotropha endolucinida]